MPKIPDDPATLRDKAFAYEALGDLEGAVRYWKAALAAASQEAGGVNAGEVRWLGRRLLYAQSVLDLMGDSRDAILH